MLDQTRVPPAKGKGSKLTAKMESFVNEYFVDLNASQACLRAGYKTRSPNKMATKLMNHPLVQEEIKKRMELRQEKAELTAEYVLTKLVSIVDKTEEANPQAALRGLELLGKHLGLYRDRQEISGPDGEAIHVKEEQVRQNVEHFKSKLTRLANRTGTGNVVEFPESRGDGQT